MFILPYFQRKMLFFGLKIPENGNFRRDCLQKRAAGNKKFFDPTIFQKCWRGVGEQPTFAKQMKLHSKLQQKSKKKSEKLQLPSKSEGCNKIQGFRGNCSSQGKLGMCPSLAEPDSGGFPRTIALRENGLQHPAKGGSTPAFACQRAAIVPLPCPNLQSYFSFVSKFQICKFSKMQLQLENQIPKLYLLRKCGLLAHTSAAFLKNCCTEKLFNCLRLVFCNQLCFIRFLICLHHNR